jgi:hypothetical protein
MSGLRSIRKSIQRHQVRQDAERQLDAAIEKDPRLKETLTTPVAKEKFLQRIVTAVTRRRPLQQRRSS